MTTTNITSYKTGTTQEILNLDPSTPGVIAVSTDTNSMFISNGTGWSETVVHKRLGKQHTLSNGDTINETPILHFDANNRNTLLTESGSTCIDGDEVATWNSLNSSERMTQDVHSRPVYVSSDSNNNAMVDCNVRNGMCLDTTISPKRTGSFSLMMVYTPTRDDNQVRVYTGPGDSSSGTTDGGGRYSYSKFQKNYTTSFHEQLFTSDYIRDYGQTSDSLGLSLYQYTSDETMRFYHPGGYSGYFAQIDGRYDLTTLADDPSITDLDHYNNNYRGKPQIISMRVSSNGSNNPTYMSCIMHTWHEDFLNRGRQLYSGNINTPNPSLHKMSIGGRGLADTPTAYLSPNGYHELMVFGSYLSDRDMNTIGTHLSQKWNTRFWDLTFEL